MESKAIQLVPLNRIKLLSNVRERLVESEQDALAANIERNGMLGPCIGYEVGSDVALVAGYRRVDAMARAGKDAVPMILLDHVPTATEFLVLQLSENCLRSGLTVSERARAYDRLMNESGWSAAEVATNVCDASEPMISKLRTLLVFSKEVQDHIDAGRIPISSAYAIATVNDADERQRLVAAVLDGRLKRDALVKRIKALKSNQRQPQRPRQAKRPPRERVTVPLGAGRTITVVGPGLCVETLITWLEELVNRIKIVNTASVRLKDLATLLRSPQTVER